MSWLILLALGIPIPRALPQWPPALEFRGLRVGIAIHELRHRIRELGGTLTCRPSRDPRLDECTGSFRPAPGGPLTAVIVSSVRDSAAVLIASGSASRETVAAWADSLALTQGVVRPRDRGPQRVWQWVRRRQMLRLIHRREGSADVLTVTLTDGPLLDGLGVQRPGASYPPE